MLCKCSVKINSLSSTASRTQSGHPFVYIARFMQHIPQWEKKMFSSYIVGLIPVHLFISSHWRPLLLMLQSWRLLVNVSVLKKSLVKLRSAGLAQIKFFLSSMEVCGAPGWIFLHPTVKMYQLEKQMRVHITLVTELFPLTNLTKLSTEEASGGAHIWSHPFFFVSKHQSREWHQTADPQKKTTKNVRHYHPSIISRNNSRLARRPQTL